MKNHEQKPNIGPAAQKNFQLYSTQALHQTDALKHLEASLDDGLAESFPASDPVAIDTRPPEQLTCMQAGLRDMHCNNISCVIEYEKFVIELNAEERHSSWFPAFQIYKDGMVVVPWMTPTVSASLTKRDAIQIAVERAVTDIRGGLATAFC